MTFLGRIFERTRPLAEEEAFARFYESTHLNVYRFMMALRGGMQDEAEDITAEAYLRAWKNRHQFDGSPEEALGWILTIARRILIDRYRLASRAPEVDLSDELADGAPDAESILVVGEQMEQVLDALQGLSDTQREIVLLRHMLGWRVTQIAAHLDLSENTVSVNLRRALKRTQETLASQGGSHER